MGDRSRPYRSILARCCWAALPLLQPIGNHEPKEALMSTSVPLIVSQYFDFDAVRDVESIIALFADDATVIDENETRQGNPEIRAWQEGPASKYTYTTEIRVTSRLEPDRYVVDARLTGNFPGGTADLKFDFTIADEHITRLVIAP
jgi:hypothetical protein